MINRVKCVWVSKGKQKTKNNEDESQKGNINRKPKTSKGKGIEFNRVRTGDCRRQLDL